MWRLDVWSLGALLAWVESRFLLEILARLAGILGSSLAMPLDDEIRVLAHTVWSSMVDAV